MIDSTDKDDLIDVLESCIYRLANHYKPQEFRSTIEEIVMQAILDAEADR